MGYSTLELTFDRGIAHLQLIRPQSYNSMNRAFWREWPEILEEIRKADDIRVVVISSTGKHFSAGLDLEIFSNPDPRLFSGEPARRGEFMRRLVLELQDYFTQLEQLRMPVLAAIHGGCIGGALDLVCACDIRYCTEDAFFTLKETAVGMTADLGTLQRLPTIINPGLAKEMAYTSRKV
ncbi:MAG: enoyl-CoA hydratase, partial [Desulfobulbaceae bacterium]|nr:enoyl-CoA hydratase [Desulfobulbaceae bacterium]